MRTHTFQTPTGTQDETDFMQRILHRIMSELQIYDSTTVKVKRTTRGITLHAAPRTLGGGGTATVYHPFKLYKSPANPDWTSEEATDQSWRTVRVRSGRIGQNILEDDFTPTDEDYRNTDGVSNPDDANDIPAWDDTVEILLDDAATTIYIWIQTGIDAAEIRFASTAPDEWTTPDGTVTPVAEVAMADAVAAGTKNLFPKYVRQLLRADIPEFGRFTVCEDGGPKTYVGSVRKETP